jgi:uncharacterized protein (DUF488 family)
VKIFTIGFTKKSAEDFFTKLRSSGAKRLVDVRLNNVSQLAGFAKKSDLKFFLREIASMDYVHVPLLAPTQELLDRYKKKGGQWSDYERDFLELMKSRQIEVNVPKAVIADGCLLCSEERPEHCHRRLVADYLKERWGDVETVHLV